MKMPKMSWDQRSMDKLKQEEKIKKCPDCGSEDLGFSEGERFCKKCGLVLD